MWSDGYIYIFNEEKIRQCSEILIKIGWRQGVHKSLNQSVLRIKWIK